LQDKKEIKYGAIMLVVFYFICFLRYYDGGINLQATTVFAFSYKYGFVSRGFMGTVLLVLNKILPFELLNYDGILALSMIATIILGVLLFVFFYAVIRKSQNNNIKYQQYLMIFCSVFSFTFFWTEQNFGRLDTYLAIVMLLSMILLVIEKCEWLIILLSIIGVLIHQGYVFMNVGIVLAFLLYKAVFKEKKRYYLLLFFCTLISVSILFLYFEFFSHINGNVYYDEIVSFAKSLSYNGNSYYEALVNHELLGQGVFEEEWPYHIVNYIESVQFVILWIPYIILGFKFIKKCYNHIGEKKDRLVYLIVFLGAFTVIPEMILKVDYGRYIYEIVFYYIAMIMMLIVVNDRVVITSISDIKKEVGGKALGILVAYSMIFMPFLDVLISRASRNMLFWMGLSQ